jgi:hypothetical protein
MAANYVLLEKITVGAAGASSVTFNSIPQTGYTDLVVKASVSTTASNGFVMSINGSTANFTYKLLEGDGAAAASYSGTTGRVAYAFNSTSVFSNLEVYIPNYTSANNKSFSVDGVSEQNATTAYADLTAGLWSQTAAITSLGFNFSAGNLQPNSTFYLYGVAALGTTPAIVPYATGGDTIMTDGTYWYHAFKSSGTFTPATGKSLSCDVLVVAGGAGGGGNSTGSGGVGGGGGGAGGYRSTTALSVLSATTVTVGGGGAGGISSGGQGSNGSDSVFSSLTSTGGGGGAGTNANGSNGGSGGGGYFNYSGGISSPVTSPVQGFAGGGGATGASYRGGGGGGASAAGVSAIVANPDGGAGSNSLSSWLSVVGLGVCGYVAGGGGGGAYIGTNGAGGAGGGGTGGPNGGTPTSGTANTGSGGGGAGYTASNAGGNGGSGLVIVRYAV